MPGDKVSYSSLGHKSLVKFKGFVKQTFIFMYIKETNIWHYQMFNSQQLHWRIQDWLGYTVNFRNLKWVLNFGTWNMGLQEGLFKFNMHKLVFYQIETYNPKEGSETQSKLDMRIIRSDSRCSGPKQSKTERKHQLWQEHDDRPIKEHSSNMFNLPLHFTLHTSHSPSA